MFARALDGTKYEEFRVAPSSDAPAWLHQNKTTEEVVQNWECTSTLLLLLYQSPKRARAHSRKDRRFSLLLCRLFLLTSSNETQRSRPSTPAWQNLSEQDLASTPRLLSVMLPRLKGDESQLLLLLPTRLAPAWGLPTSTPASATDAMRRKARRGHADHLAKGAICIALWCSGLDSAAMIM